MIDIIGFDGEGNIVENTTIDNIFEDHVKWFWVDFNHPTDDEVALLSDVFHFHHLTIEDCLQFLQRPKVEFFEDYYFFVFHALAKDLEIVEEINLYLGKNYVVSFHLKKDIFEIQEVKKELLNNKIPWEKTNVYISYLILDEIVDQYFPLVYEIEDQLDEFDNSLSSSMSKDFIDKLYTIRGNLLKLRRTITSMRDLSYRIINSEHLREILGKNMYYVDIYDHLFKLSDMIEANREMTSDIRDNYMSINANRTNTIMTILTIITAIFIPLTFIAGIYGMNFANMPELDWKYGYFIVLGVMMGLAIGMYIWFKKKGWFDL